MSIQRLSLLNMVLAIAYALVYFKSGTLNSAAGIFMIIVFNWLGLKSFERGEYRWWIWHYLTGAWVIYFVGTLIYGSINILRTSLEYNDVSSDVLTNLIVTFGFCVLISVHFCVYFYKNYLPEDDD